MLDLFSLKRASDAIKLSTAYSMTEILLLSTASIISNCFSIDLVRSVETISGTYFRIDSITAYLRYVASIPLYPFWLAIRAVLAIYFILNKVLMISALVAFVPISSFSIFFNKLT